MAAVSFNSIKGSELLSVSIFLSLFMAGAPTFAQYTVDTYQDGEDVNLEDGVCATIDGDCSLRAALQQAGVDSLVVEISLPSGIYAWNLGQLLIESGDITVNGGGTRTTIVDAFGGQRFFEIDGNNTLVTLRDFELRNGFSANQSGGAIETDGDLLTLERMCFRDCVTEDAFGGAIHNREDLEIQSSVFINCKAYGNDGANGGGGGGGSLGAGGAICCWSGTELWVENSTFVGCEAHGGNGGAPGGGGQGGDGGDGIGSFGGGGDGGDITSSTWGGNYPDAGTGGFGGGGGGGGIYTTWWNPSGGDASAGLGIGGAGGDGTVNAAGSGGGGGGLGGAIFMRSGQATLSHCTISENGAYGGAAGAAAVNQGEPGQGKGGGIGCFDGTLTLDNCIISGNVGGDAGGNEDLYHFSGESIQASVGNNIIGAVDVDITFAGGVMGNMIGVDPVLLPFGDYGGPTDAFMISACEPLSPAIDAGAALGITEDQRGKPRDLMSDIGSTEWTLSDGVFKSCPGCSCSLAHNYSPQVTHDDGSCIILGCIDSSAVNYLISANSPIPCIYNAPGCVWDTSEWEWDCSEFCDADINQDGLVNVPDLLILLGQFAGGCE